MARIMPTIPRTVEFFSSQVPNLLSGFAPALRGGFFVRRIAVGPGPVRPIPNRSSRDGARRDAPDGKSAASVPRFAPEPLTPEQFHRLPSETVAESFGVQLTSQILPGLLQARPPTKSQLHCLALAESRKAEQLQSGVSLRQSAHQGH